MSMRILRNVALSGVGLVALIGVLHMPIFRSTLMSLAGCPFPTSGRTLSATEAEALRVKTFAPHSNDLAHAMPALGFALGTDDRAHIARWAQKAGVTCTPDKHGASLRCTDVPASALSLASASRGLLGLGFDTQDRLVSVQFSLNEPAREAALQLARQAEQDMARASTPKLVRDGSLAGPLSQRTAQVALRDYRGEVKATNMGPHINVTQSYQRFAL
jgi:hypothetical protein